MDGSRLALLIIFEPHKNSRFLRTNAGSSELWDFTEDCAWQPLGFGYSAVLDTFSSFICLQNKQLGIKGAVGPF